MNKSYEQPSVRFHFPNLPPFPDDVPTAPLLRLSLGRLLNHDAHELQRLWAACCDVGFFYLEVGGAYDADHNISGDALIQDVDSLFQVQDKFFDLSVEEKVKYDFKEQGSYFGYKGYGHGIIDKQGRKDRNEFYNISKDDMLDIGPRLPAPSVLDDDRPLFKSFIRSSHTIVTLLLDLLNLYLHLAPSKLSSLHRLERVSGDQIRFVKAPPQPMDDRQAALGAHTDFGSVTLLWNRLGGLQIVPPGRQIEDEASWVYVKPLRGCCVVNLGDALVKMTRGLLRSNIHRVVNPPGEQGDSTRYSLVYFARPEDDVPLKALEGSSLIDKQKSGLEKEDDEEVITSKEWILRRALGRRGVGDWDKSDGTERTSASTMRGMREVTVS